MINYATQTLQITLHDNRKKKPHGYRETLFELMPEFYLIAQLLQVALPESVKL